MMCIPLVVTNLIMQQEGTYPYPRAPIRSRHRVRFSSPPESLIQDPSTSGLPTSAEEPVLAGVVRRNHERYLIGITVFNEGHRTQCQIKCPRHQHMTIHQQVRHIQFPEAQPVSQILSAKEVHRRVNTRSSQWIRYLQYVHTCVHNIR